MFQVLVAEDEVWIRDALVEMIDKLNPQFTVIGDVSNGAEAWDFIQENWPSIVVTDIMMPRNNGLWLSEKIYEMNLPIEVIIASGYDNFQYAKQAMRFGIHEYLLKPIDETELHGALQRAVKRLEGMLEMRESILKIQQYIDKFQGFGQQKQLQEMNSLVAHILRIKTKSPAAGKSLLSILSNKLNELLQGMNPTHTFIPLKEHEEKSIHKYFHDLVEMWIMAYPAYSNQNVHAVIEKVCEYIENHYYDDFSLTKLAERAHLSVSYFSTLFKKVKGQTCLNYYNQVRMDKAKELMLEPDLKIYEVANMVGYNSMPYFNRLFKELVGMTPIDYRKRLGV